MSQIVLNQRLSDSILIRVDQPLASEQRIYFCVKQVEADYVRLRFELSDYFAFLHTKELQNQPLSELRARYLPQDTGTSGMIQVKRTTPVTAVLVMHLRVIYLGTPIFFFKGPRKNFQIFGESNQWAVTMKQHKKGVRHGS